jgi:hypothetical protein
MERRCAAPTTPLLDVQHLAHSATDTVLTIVATQRCDCVRIVPSLHVAVVTLLLVSDMPHLHRCNMLLHVCCNVARLTSISVYKA